MERTHFKMVRLSATIGGVLWIGAVPVLLNSLDRDSFDTTTWTAFGLSCVLLIVGLLGLHAQQADRMPLLGPAGLFVCVLALVLLPLVLFFFHIVALPLAVGAAVYGIATIRARVLPGGGSWLLTLGGLPFLTVGLVHILGYSVALALCDIEQEFDRTLTPSELRCMDRADLVEGWLLIGFAAAFGLGVIWLAWGRGRSGTTPRPSPQGTAAGSVDTG
jgi:hypothetical protein